MSHRPVSAVNASAPARVRDSAGSALVAVGVCAAVYVAAAIAMSKPGGFWSPDSAVRFVQVESLLRTGFRTVAIPYPAASLDPAGRFFPFGPWFHFTRAGQYYLSYPPYFAMLVAPMYRWFGLFGLLILPIAGGLAAVFVTYRFLSSRTPELAMTGALALGLATPLVAYSATFWDHSLAVALGAGALALLARDRELTSGGHLILAGGMLGAGVWFRNEMYLLALACLAAWLYAAPLARWQGALRIAAGLAVPAVVLWGLNYRLTGNLLGWKTQDVVTGRVARIAAVAAGHGAASWIVDKLGNLYFQLISPDYYGTGPWALLGGAVLAALVVLAGVLMNRGVAYRSANLITVGGAVGVIVGITIISGRTTVSGLVASAPWVALTLLSDPRAPRERLLWMVVGLFTAAVIATGTHGGLQWGPRYLLPVFPALVWLAAFGADRARAAAPGIWPSLCRWAAALLAVSALIQLSGVDQIAQGIDRSARINAILEAAPAEIIITPLEWITLGAGPVYFEKSLMLVSSPEEFHDLVETLAARHVRRWAYIPLLPEQFVPRSVARWVAGGSWHFRAVDDRMTQQIRLTTFSGSSDAP
jgi:hypothetical protein